MVTLPFEKKNVLVTGGAGFIGSHLCERLLKDDCRIICIDDFSTGSVNNINALLQMQDFKLIKANINQPINLEKYPELEAYKIPFQGIQEIYHLACPMAIKKFDEFKTQTLLTNSIGNYNILELAKKYRSKVLLASSSVVYGSRTGDGETMGEEYKGVVDHLSPRACYDEGKVFSETMFETYRQVHGLEVKIGRIFRTYGPRMPLFDGHLIPDFVLQAVDNKDLIIYGDEDFKTSLVYVTDAIDALLRLMGAPADVGPVNIGSDVDLKFTDVAAEVLKMTGSSSKIVHEPSLPFLTYLGLPKIAKAKDLGWFPLVRLEDGLQATIDYIKANKLVLSNI